MESDKMLQQRHLSWSLCRGGLPEDGTFEHNLEREFGVDLIRSIPYGG